MTVTVHTDWTFQTAATGGNTALTFDKPTGTVSGNVMLCVITFDAAAASSFVTWSLPSGWVSHVFEDNGASAWPLRYVFWKLAGGSEPATYTFTPTLGGGTINLGHGIFFRASGVDNTTPFDVSGVVSNNGGTTGSSGTGPSITTTSANASVISVIVFATGSGFIGDSASYPSGYDQIALRIGAASSSSTTIGIASKTQALAGASGSIAWGTVLSGVALRGYVTMALREAVTTGLTITSVTPSSFDSGTAGIVIAGNGFGASQGSSTVTIGSQAQTVTSWSDTSITITSARGSNSMGAGQLKVTIR